MKYPVYCPEPTTVEMRQRLAEDMQARRYSSEVLLAIMHLLDGTPDAYNALPIFSVEQPVGWREAS